MNLRTEQKNSPNFNEKRKRTEKNNPQSLGGLWNNDVRLVFSSSESQERRKRAGLEECIKK